MAKEPAWAKWSKRNMRGEVVKFGRHNWTVLTHLRGGVWRVYRCSRYSTDTLYADMKLDRHGGVVDVRRVWQLGW